MSEKHTKWLIATAIVVALIGLAIAWYFGHNAGIAAGAAAGAAAASKYWAARGRDEEVIDDASEAITVGVDRIKDVREDADKIIEENRSEVAGMTGEDKADLIDTLTDTE